MKLLKNFPKKLFKSKKSRLDNSSFGSATSSDSSEFKKQTGSSTPTSVLPPNEIDWFQNTHEDRAGYGKIRLEELQLLLSRVGAESLSEEEVKLMLSEVDRDGDGCISLEELSFFAAGGGSGSSSAACDDELRDAFDFFDADHDGKITAEELYNVFTTIGDARCTLEDCRRMISGVDANGDGFVCFEDFSRMMDQQLLHR